MWIISHPPVAWWSYWLNTNGRNAVVQQAESFHLSSYSKLESAASQQISLAKAEKPFKRGKISLSLWIHMLRRDQLFLSSVLDVVLNAPRCLVILYQKIIKERIQGNCHAVRCPIILRPLRKDKRFAWCNYMKTTDSLTGRYTNKHI